MSGQYAYVDKYGQVRTSPQPAGNLTPRKQQYSSATAKCHCCGGSMKLGHGSKWWWWHVIAMCAIGMNFLMLLVILGLSAFVVHQVR